MVMKKFFKFVAVSVMLLVSSFSFGETTTIATIAEAKKLGSYTNVLFSGELTLQYVAISSSGVNYYAFDSNNEYVRLRCYNWGDLKGTERELFVGDNISIAGEVTIVNDDNSCMTFDLEQADLKTITVTGRGWPNPPTIVTIEQLKADVNKEFNANFVSIENASVESFWDPYVSPMPVNDIVVGADRIPFIMEDIMTDFPAKANIIGYVDYENGSPKLYIPQFEGFVEPVAFDNISGTKHFKGQLGYDSVGFKSTVLVTDVQEIDTAYFYRVQKNDASGVPSAMQMYVPKSLNLVYQVGDSVAFDVKGHYVSSIYEECSGAIDKMTSSLFTIKVNYDSKVVSKNNPILLSSFNTTIVDDTEEHWTRFDNCLVTTLKGNVIVSDELTAVGCVALRLLNAVSAKYDTVLVANTYYVEAGSPKSTIVCGFVGGYEYGGESYTALIPRSKNDFLSEVMEFDNIAAMKAAGKTPSRAISYKINSAMAITGFTSVTDMSVVYTIFVQDETGCLQLNHESLALQNKYKIGDVITGVSGYYNGFAGSSYYTDEFGYVFASAPVMELKVESVVASDKQYVAQPVEITLDQLDDSYASQLITIKDVNYKKETIILSTEDKYLPIIYSGDDWAIVSEDYTYSSEISSITGVYFLYSKLTKIIPRNQNDIVNSGAVDVENIVADNNLFVQNKVVYAEGAMIEVYDVMGRLLASNANSVDISLFDGAVIVVKTNYDNDMQFITKFIVR